MAHPGGRPTLYKEDYVKQVYKLCLLSATDKEIADFFDIEESTLNLWKNEHPEFMESIKRGKIQADADIAKSLYNRAKGYSHPDVHISNYQGEVTVTPITKHYPPDTAAAIIWLKNRQPDKWRDRIETTTDVTITIESAEERRAKILEYLQRPVIEGVKAEYKALPEPDQADS
jgi:hypothetical protein